MKDLMVDIETLGTRPHAPILSVAFVMFDDEKNGGHMNRRLRWEGQIRGGRKIEPDTLTFWMNQPSEISKRWREGSPPLRDEHVLSQFWHFVSQVDRVWAFSPSFDLVMLTEYSHELNIPVPRNSYRKQRDVRTISDFLTQDEWPAAREGAHDPLVDCEFQIDVVRSFWKKFGSPYGVVHAASEPAAEPVHPSGEEATAAAQEGSSS